MTLDTDTCYRALCARDRRFDGTFFVGVRTTGIYCRPICPARTPARERCTYYELAAEAERDGYRSCFRCRPERAPGGRADEWPAVVSSAVARIAAGGLNGASMSELAAVLGVTDRHLRRLVVACAGVTPVELAQTCRLALANQLIRDTHLPLIHVAFASGFASVRRFNALYRARFGQPPSMVRRAGAPTTRREVISIQLEYRPPFDWNALLSFLEPRLIAGVERIDGDCYQRTAAFGSRTGWLSVHPSSDGHALVADVSLGLTGCLMPLLARLRALFDLDARPTVIADHLRSDPLLAESIERHPGVRVPGAFDGFEMAVRAILGQQVSVRGASTLAGRLVRKLGRPVETPLGGVDLVFPSPQEVASRSERELASIGLPIARARSVRAMAQAVIDGRVRLEGEFAGEAEVTRLMQVDGVGAWTAQYIALRALGWPDAFPATDLGIRKAMSRLSPVEIERRAERWRPWRSYAAMHLWSLHSGGAKA